MTNNINKGDYVLIDNSNVEGIVKEVTTRKNGTFVILEGGISAFPIEDAYVISKHVEEESQKDFKVYNGELPRPIGVNDVFMPYSYKEDEDENEEHELADTIKADAINADESFVNKILGHRIAIEPKEQYETDPGDEVEDTKEVEDDVKDDVDSIIDKAIEELFTLKAKLNA
ncbi:hypothetical protein EVU91_01320 [Macrococcoides bohemicum]|uniref:hypothetical protein n=1 Tax=Macrococcoides bohemicum TaxID=1903056 RepID=UPI001059FC9E|nr:hypothetical protein [Macrococcus bohemicus]TDL40558.1 hypothetical protein EVU91_01320 [Macrococcus bohemicus]